jgi:hypothetical protein
MAGIFINYRRDDAAGAAGRLFDHLAKRFSRRKLFMDVDTIKPGIDFVRQLDAQIAQCDVLLAVIGPRWLDASDAKGQRRLESRQDFVRIEIASALKRGIPVIPVLVDGATVPSEEDLTEDIKSLARRHALELRHTRFSADADAIVQALNRLRGGNKRGWFWKAAAAGIAILACIVVLLELSLTPPAPVQRSVETPTKEETPTKVETPVEIKPVIVKPQPVVKPDPQKAVLYEDAASPEGKRYVGSVLWSTDPVEGPEPGSTRSFLSSLFGGSSTLDVSISIRADVQVPERKFAMTWVLFRNTDKNRPASHIVEIIFKLPADFPPGGIQSVPGFMMKQAEQTPGTPLPSTAVKIASGHFRIALSRSEAEKERNIQLLKRLPWFDIPVVYNNSKRAIIAMEKGAPGERVFAEAFRVWKQ